MQKDRKERYEILSIPIVLSLQFESSVIAKPSLVGSSISKFDLDILKLYDLTSAVDVLPHDILEYLFS